MMVIMILKSPKTKSNQLKIKMAGAAMLVAVTMTVGETTLMVTKKMDGETTQMETIILITTIPILK